MSRPWYAALKPSVRARRPSGRIVLAAALALATSSSLAGPAKKNDEARLRSELRERNEEIQKLKKQVTEKNGVVKKLQQEVDAWKKKPVVPGDNVGLVPYDMHELFAKETPAGTGPVLFDYKKGATLLVVWKHGSSGGSSDGKPDSSKPIKWEYATLKLSAENNTREVRVNLHKGNWSVYRSSPKAGYVHIADIQVTDKLTTVSVPED